MSDDGLLSKIQKLIKDEIRPAKDLLELTKKKVDTLDFFIGNTAENVRMIKEQQSLVNEKVNELKVELKDVKNDIVDVKRVLDANTESVVSIEQTIKVYGDMYKINNDNAKKLEKRTEVLEKKAGINPPPEQILAEIH